MQELYLDTRVDLFPWKINNVGQVLGGAEFEKGTGYKQSFLWDSTRGIEYCGDRFLADINDSGQIVGQIEGRATLWNSPNDIQNLGSLNKKGEARVTRINNVGQAIGNSSSCQTWPCGSHGFFWDKDSGMTDIGTLGSNYSWAYGMNDLGQVVGSSTVRGGFYGERRAFLWDKTRGMQNLGTLDDRDSYAIDINNRGQAIGWVVSYVENEQYENEQYEYRAFLWDKTFGLQDLNQFIDPNAGWILSRARAINQKGWILGAGFFNGNKCNFLLIPQAGDRPSEQP